MLFQELSKLKRSSIMMSIILMAVGIVMIICPAPYIDSVVSVLGYGILILAAIMILDFIAGRKGLMNYIYLTGGLITPGCTSGPPGARTGGSWPSWRGC